MIMKIVCTSVEIKVDGFAETVAQSVQLGVQDLHGNITGDSMRNQYIIYAYMHI